MDRTDCAQHLHQLWLCTRLRQSTHQQFPACYILKRFSPPTHCKFVFILRRLFAGAATQQEGEKRCQEKPKEKLVSRCLVESCF